MKSSFKITIPEPCHENWAQMTPTQKGRHSASCKKEVIMIMGRIRSTSSKHKKK